MLNFSVTRTAERTATATNTILCAAERWWSLCYGKLRGPRQRLIAASFVPGQPQLCWLEQAHAHAHAFQAVVPIPRRCSPRCHHNNSRSKRLDGAFLVPRVVCKHIVSTTKIPSTPKSGFKASRQRGSGSCARVACDHRDFSHFVSTGVDSAALRARGDDGCSG